MAILNTTGDLKKHVAVAQSFIFEDFEPYIDQAVYQFTEKYVGNLEETLADAATGGGAAIKNKARHILQNALTNFGLYIYTPMGSVFMDSSGFSNVVSENKQTLEWQQVKDLQRGFLKAGHTAMDRLLKYLETNKGSFPEWAASKCYTESKQLLVNNTDVFNDAYTIKESRQTYLALRPSIRQVEDQYIKNQFGKEILTHLKTQPVADTLLELKESMQKAIVAFTVGKVCKEGLFTIDAGGLYVRFDVLPTDRVAAPDPDFIKETASIQVLNGQNYLKQAINIIKNNTEDFTQWPGAIITTSEGLSNTVYNTSGIVSF